VSWLATALLARRGGLGFWLQRGIHELRWNRHLAQLDSDDERNRARWEGLKVRGKRREGDRGNRHLELASNARPRKQVGGSARAFLDSTESIDGEDRADGLGLGPARERIERRGERRKLPRGESTRADGDETGGLA
jgi:hypothetical protein